jgi:hypothetical protein
MKKTKLENFVNKHGEAHVYIEEHETVVGTGEPIGIRKGDPYSFHSEYVEIDTGSTKQFVFYDRIVHVELPADFPD